MTKIVAYLATGLAFLAIDSIWLSVMASRLYRPQLGGLMAPSFSLAPAALFYLIYIAGVVWFAVLPAVEQRSWVSAAVSGGLFGLCAYATYDLTNQATLRGWPVAVTVADLIWGAVVTAIAATVGALVTGWFAGWVSAR